MLEPGQSVYLRAIEPIEPASSVRCPSATPAMNTPFAYGEKVLLLDLKQRRYLITLAEGAEFHSHAGFVAARRHRRSARTATTVRSTRGARRMSPCDPRSRISWSRCPAGAARVIYPKDLGPICMIADIAPGVRVLESGVGAGASA